MADKPIREQSALELMETHAKALEEQRDACLVRLGGWIDKGPPPVEVVAASDYRDALARIEKLTAENARLIALLRGKTFVTGEPRDG